MKKYSYIPVLTIAGFDGSGGAGIQADIKTFSALGCYATSVLTALPVQNTQGVRTIHPISCTAVKEQIEALMDDISPATIKIGMVHTPELVETIVETLSRYPAVPLIFDPVMVATSGHRLIEEDTITAIVRHLLPRAEMITPNMDEAAILAGMPVKTTRDMIEAGERILKLGCRGVLMKGGHLEADILTSYYLGSGGICRPFEHKKFNTRNTHGSGCTLSSAIAAYRARGKTPEEAVILAQQYVHEAIRYGRNVQTGKGNGPLNHFFKPQKMIKNVLV